MADPDEIARAMIANIRAGLERGDQFYIHGTDTRLATLGEIWDAVSRSDVQVQVESAFADELPDDWQVFKAS